MMGDAGRPGSPEGSHDDPKAVKAPDGDFRGWEATVAGADAVAQALKGKAGPW